MARNSRIGALVLVLSLAAAIPLHGQMAPDTAGSTSDTSIESRSPLTAYRLPLTGRSPLSAPSSPEQGSFRWYHAGAVLGVVALASLLDEPLRDNLQAHRTSTKDDIASVFRHMGQPEVYATVGLGTLLVGLAGKNDKVLRAGGRITAGLLVAGGLGVITKEIVGRFRPTLTGSAYQFKPFSGHDSWPSGHTTMAFALATSVSDEVKSTPVTVALYAGATLTGWSRLNDNKHWLSDVLAGASLGFTSAKLMNGHWKVFGVGAPKFLLDPGGVAVGWEF